MATSIDIQNNTSQWAEVPGSRIDPPKFGTDVKKAQEVIRNGTNAAGGANVLNKDSKDKKLNNIPFVPEATKEDNNEKPKAVVEEQIKQAEIQKFIFPEQLRSVGSSEYGPFIKISGYTYKRGFVRPEDKTKKLEIYLPIPQVISQEYSASLSNFEGSIVFDAASATGGALGGSEAMKSVLGGTAFAGAGAISAMVNRFAQGTGSQVLQTLQNSLKEARNLVSTQIGYSLNPRYEVAFNSMGLRQHGFEFNLVPLSEREAKEVDDLVHALRLASHPVTSDEQLGVFYKYPDEFVISFHDADGVLLRAVPYIPDCIISNLGVSTSTGRMHSDNSPVATKLSVQFQEMTSLSRDDIRNISSYREQYYK